jgi:Na+/H+ antiporter NhaD/arsenite permease-like protein
MIDWLAVGLFTLTYVLISLRRLSWLGFDRPAGALLGAVLTVAFGVLTPEGALGAIDGSTILLLFGVMGLGAFLDLDGFFVELENRLVAFARTPARLLAALVWGSGLLAALITNDAVCVLGAPLVVRIVKRQQLPALPFLLAVATASNTGSVATLVGNPQNMLCASLGGLSYRSHLVLLAPVALLGLAINHVVLQLSFGKLLARHQLRAPESAPAPLGGRIQVSLAVIAATAVVYTAGANLPWTATAAFVLLMLLHRRDTTHLWSRIDFTLLLFFAGLFVAVEGFRHSGAPAAFFARVPLDATVDGSLGGWAWLAAVFSLGSNLVSNVPFIVLISDQMKTLSNPTLGWELLAMASTFAGNLTLLGSVANVIVAEQARELGGIGFVEYLRVGFPVAVLTTLLGVLWLVLMH